MTPGFSLACYLWFYVLDDKRQRGRKRYILSSATWLFLLEKGLKRESVQLGYVTKCNAKAAESLVQLDVYTSAEIYIASKRNDLNLIFDHSVFLLIIFHGALSHSTIARSCGQRVVAM